MEALAREAGVAEGALYARFADKEAAIAVVVDELLVELQAAFERGMAGGGSAAERIGAALAGKYAIVARALEGSPHADEIFDAHRRYAARFAALERRVEAQIAAELAKAGASDPATLARLVIGAASGVARSFSLSGAEAIDGAIRLVCRRIIEPAARG